MGEVKQSELKALGKEMIKVGIIDAPGAILVGVALYAKFAVNGQPFHPILNNESVVMSLFLVGGAIMLWGFSKMARIAMRRSALTKNKPR